MSVGAFLSRVTNLRVHNFSSRRLSAAETRTLALGLGFVPTPRPCRSDLRLRMALNDLQRLLKLRFHFGTSAKRRSALRAPSDGRWEPPRNPIPSKYATKIQEASTALLATFQRLLPTRTFTRRNLTSAQWRLLHRLQRDDSIIIKPADKNLGLTLMDREWYEREALGPRHLGNESVYRALGELTDPAILMLRVFNDLRRLIDTVLPAPPRRQHGPALLSDAARRSLREFLLHRTPPSLSVNDDDDADDSASATRHQARVPFFYLLPKVHKPQLVGRPIVASTSWITTPAAQWLDRELQPLVLLLPSYIADSTALVNQLETTVFDRTPGRLLLFTADVESLYTNIPTDAGLVAIAQALDALSSYNAEKKRAILRVLEFVLRNNYFQFNGKFYLQLQGTAMGSNVAPAYANLYVYWTVERLRCVGSQCHPQLLFWRRYIDDCFGVTTMAPKQAAAFFRQLETRSGLRFTLELSRVSADFLDCHISFGDRFRSSGVLDIAVHQKLLNTYLYIPFSSYHPLAMKRGFVKGELIRYVRLSSSAVEFRRVQKLFWHRLRARGYPASLLRTVFAQVPYTDRPRYLQQRSKTRTITTALMPANQVLAAPVVLKTPMNPAFDNLPYRDFALTLTTPSVRVICVRTKAPSLRSLLVRSDVRPQVQDVPVAAQSSTSGPLSNTAVVISPSQVAFSPT